MKFEWSFAPTNPSRPAAPSDPCRVLILGSFSGAAEASSNQPLKAHRVDLDSFDSLFSKLLPEWTPSNSRPLDPPLSLSFSDLESFHPDALIRRIPRLKDVLHAYSLLDTQPQEATQRLLQWLPSDSQPHSTPASSTTTASTPSSPVQPEPEPDLMERLLGRPQTPSTSEPQKKASDVVQALIQSILPPSAPSPSSAQATSSSLPLKERACQWLAHQLHLILHDSAFQRLETHWRGLDFLLRSLPSDSNLQIEVVDYPQEALKRSLSTGSIDQDHPLVALLADPASKGKPPYSILMATYPLCSPASDLAWASFLAHLGATLHLPVLLSAQREWIHHLPLRESSGAPSEVLQGWETFRMESSSRYLAVSGPDFLLRQPYGKKSDPIESFDFEENAHPVEHGRYLWGPSSWMTLKWILESYANAEGWSFDLSHRFETLGLPVHAYKIHEESTMTPCAESWWSDWEIMALCDQGLIPLVPIRGRDALFTPYLISAHKPSASLEGPWAR